MLTAISDLFTNYTFIIVALGTILLGISSGILSSFVTLSKQSLIGDALSHAALPGIVLAFMLFKIKRLELLLLGALIFSVIAVLIINLIKKYSKVKFDSALALVLSGFFGFGLLLLTILQKQPSASQAGLNSFIFGQASTILKEDIYIMLASSIFVIILVLLFWKELKLFIFNKEFAITIGYKIKYIEIIFFAMVIITLIIGLEAVGVILISAFLVAPGVAARQWTNKLSVLVILSGTFGGVASFTGTMLATIIPKLATGAIIVAIISAIALISILFGSQRGIVWKQIKTKIVNKRVYYYHLLQEIIGNNHLPNHVKILKQKQFIKIENEEICITKTGKNLLSYFEGGLNYES